jgi:diacylglycerol kinase family enzyme
VRAILVVNQTATRTTVRTRDVLVHALSADLDVDVVETTHRGHAHELALRAVAEHRDLLLVLGGDGTVNEAVNGLLVNGPAPDGPVLGVVPGGSTNVFARALGLPNDPVEATGEVLDAIREGRTRRIGLATADGRWFTFCAGLGLDAQVVAEVEDRRADGQRLSGGLFVRSAVRLFYRGIDRQRPTLTVEIPGEEPVAGVYLAIVQNTSPWTYLGSLPVNPCPEADFDTGLDLMALRRMRTVSTLRHVRQILQPGSHPRGKDVTARHDLAEFTVWSDVPCPFQIDGESLEDRMSVRFQAVPEAVSVLV